MCYKVLLINIVALVLCSGQTTTILNIAKNGAALTCDETAITVVEKQPLDIQVKHDGHISKITCVFGIYKWEEFDQNYIKIENVLLYDNGTCMITTSQSHATVNCEIAIHLRWIEAPQVILVNGMVLPSARAALDEPHDALAEYTFNDGDLVDVACANRDLEDGREPRCLLNMHYDFIEGFSIPDTQRKDLPNKDPVGFQLRMRAGHDNTHATCTCHFKTSSNLYSDKSIVRVNFNMRKTPIGNSVNIYINDAILRPTTDVEDEFEYQYKLNENVLVKCETIQDGDTILFEWISEPYYDMYKELTKNETSITLYLNLKYYETLSFQCLTKTKKTIVTLKPKELFEGECSMRAWLERSGGIVNPSLEIYQSRYRDLIYENQDNDIFKLKCEARCRSTDYVMYLDRSDGNYIKSELYGLVTLSTSISSSEIAKQSVFKWILKHKFANIVWDRTIVFINASNAITTTEAATTTSVHGGPEGQIEESGSNSWVTAVVASVSCVLIICMILVIYKVKARRNNQDIAYFQVSEETIKFPSVAEEGVDNMNIGILSTNINENASNLHQ